MRSARDRRWRAALVAVVVLVAWAGVRSGLGPAVTAYEVTRQDVVARVVASGRVAGDGATRLALAVDERDVGSLRPGEPAIAMADAYPGQPFAAEVDQVARVVDAARGSIEVRLRMPSPPPFLLPGMAVSASVEVGRRDGALAVPADAVRDARGDAWVLAVRGGRAERRRVSLGLEGEGVFEVRGGLAAGDVVVSTSAAGVAPGQRVRPRLGRDGA